MKHFITALLTTSCAVLSWGQLNIPAYKVTRCDTASRGYYFFSPIKLGPNGPLSAFSDIILDARGQLIYFKEYEKDFKAGTLRLHSNGKYSFFFDKKFFILDQQLNIVDTISCKNGYQQDEHELLILPNGHYATLCIEVATMDLSKYFIFKKSKQQGLPNTKVRCGVIQELDENKNVVFEWHGKDHYQFDDVDTANINNLYDIDWMHMNSLEYDRDGNYIVSLKHFNEITKVNRKTGKIMWRFGGNKNQFTSLKDTINLHSPHDVRRINARHITFFDNGSSRGKFSPESAKEYRLDENSLSATLIWSHVNHPKVTSSGYGSVQRLPNRNTLVNYGRNDSSDVIFNVVTPTGKIIFEVSSKVGLRNYRAYNFWKLPAPFNQPQITASKQAGEIVLDAGAGHTKYIWSTGETSRTIIAKSNSDYHVFVPFGMGGYIRSDVFNTASINKTKNQAGTK